MALGGVVGTISGAASDAFDGWARASCRPALHPTASTVLREKQQKYRVTRRFGLPHSHD